MYGSSIISIYIIPLFSFLVGLCWLARVGGLSFFISLLLSYIAAAAAAAAMLKWWGVLCGIHLFYHRKKESKRDSVFREGPVTGCGW